jgi:hypothetical protein
VVVCADTLPLVDEDELAVALDALDVLDVVSSPASSPELRTDFEADAACVVVDVPTTVMAPPRPRNAAMLIAAAARRARRARGGRRAGRARAGPVGGISGETGSMPSWSFTKATVRTDSRSRARGR